MNQKQRKNCTDTIAIFYLSFDVTIDLLSIMTSMLCFFMLNALCIIITIHYLIPFCATSPFAPYSNLPSIIGLIGI
jgi:hypothetical protein